MILTAGLSPVVDGARITSHTSRSPQFRDIGGAAAKPEGDGLFAPYTPAEVEDLLRAAVQEDTQITALRYSYATSDVFFARYEFKDST